MSTKCTSRACETPAHTTLQTQATQGLPAVLLVLAILLLASLPVANAEETKDANSPGTGVSFTLVAPQIYTDPVPERYLEANRLWQGIPSVTITPNGRLWATWFSGGPHEPDPDNYVILATSSDGGATWSKPKLILDQPTLARCLDPQLWTDPNGKVWFFWCQTVDSWDGRGGVWAMCANDAEDENTTWTEPRRIADGIMCNKPSVDSQGRWLMPISIWRNSGERFDFGIRYNPNLYVSTDSGKSFEWYGSARVPRNVSTFDEHAAVERKDGSLWMLVRTTYGIGEATSTDQGRTWSDVTPSPIVNTSSRFAFVKLASGNILLIKNGPLNEDVGRSQLCAFLSEDDGKTWSASLLLDGRGQVWQGPLTTHALDKMVSYPNVVQTKDGTIYVVWDYDRGGQAEIRFTHFTEDDIRAGKLPDEAISTVISHR